MVERLGRFRKELQINCEDTLGSSVAAQLLTGKMFASNFMDESDFDDESDLFGSDSYEDDCDSYDIYSLLGGGESVASQLVAMEMMGMDPTDFF